MKLYTIKWTDRLHYDIRFSVPGAYWFGIYLVLYLILLSEARFGAAYSNLESFTIVLMFAMFLVKGWFRITKCWVEDEE